MRILPLGVGDAFSCRSYSSCLAVESEGFWLLLDCPHPIRKMLKEASDSAGLSLDLDAISAVALTHLHADHASGLEGCAYFSHFVLQRKLTLLVHPEVEEHLWDGHLSGSMGRLIPPGASEPLHPSYGDFFDPLHLDEAGPVKLGPFEIECRKTLHHIPTTAFRLKAGGRTFGYSADTSYDPGLIDWLAKADLFVHETNHGIHTPYSKLASLPLAVRQNMRLIHYPDDFDIAASVIEPLVQGRLYTV